MSILSDLRKECVGDETSDAFDLDLKTDANIAFGILNRLGVGPDTTFILSTNTQNWSDFTGPGVSTGMLQGYISKKVRMLFDPPANSNLSSAYESAISEMEWTMKNRAELERINS